MNKLKVIELFAGIGAQRQALKEAGINHKVVAISEVDRYALKAYELLHGDAPNLVDQKFNNRKQHEVVVSDLTYVLDMPLVRKKMHY